MILQKRQDGIHEQRVKSLRQVKLNKQGTIGNSGRGLRRMLGNIQSFRKALARNGPKTTGRNRPMVNNPVGSQFRSKLGKDFSSNNGAKILSMAYPQSLGQKDDPTSSKFHLDSCRIMEERIQHERQGMEAQGQGNQTT